jgi:hypothetical protein
MNCNACVCSVKAPESCTKDKMCEVKRGYDGKDTYNCALAPEPDREECIPSVIDCLDALANNYTHGMHVCDNCVCRDLVGTSNCASTDDCVAICNPESGCDPVTDPEYSYACVAPKCGQAIADCFTSMNANLNMAVTCDNCVCENSHHFCTAEGSTCEMTCDDPKGTS